MIPDPRVALEMLFGAGGIPEERDFSSVRGLYAEGLGLDVDVAPGAAGKQGASSPGHGPVASEGKVRSAGSVTVEALDWESWAETPAGRRWLER